MESNTNQYTPQEEINEAVEQLKIDGEWPGGEARVVTRGIMMQRRLTLMTNGIKLPPISL